MEKMDILIIGFDSGETKSLVSMAEKAKSIDIKNAAVTIIHAVDYRAISGFHH